MTFFFYDLETSGFNPREARIMQFAGQRTNFSLEPIGKPLNVFIKMTDDILPDPGAVLVTGITPQQTLEKGITEADFLKLFQEQIAKPYTIFVGYNSVRFDDEFMRFLHYRNFYDPYEWQWQDDKSRWDLLDVVRMTRALRPEGIKWPIDVDSKPTNRLELISKLNNLTHTNAHDALSDVLATIEVARLIRSKQPKLFSFLLKMRNKKEVIKIVSEGKPFIYTSGKYPSEFEKTTVVAPIGYIANSQSVMVYDLRHDPDSFIKMSPKELANAWRYNPEANSLRLPIKTLKFNRCPAVAPLSVLDVDSVERLQLNMTIIEANYQKLQEARDWIELLTEAKTILDADQDKSYSKQSKEVDSQLYDGFFNEADKLKMIAFRAATPDKLNDFSFSDSRLTKLMPLYRARNFPQSLTAKEQQQWIKHKRLYLTTGGRSSRLTRFDSQIQQVLANPKLSQAQKQIINSLIDYAKTVAQNSSVS